MAQLPRPFTRSRHLTGARGQTLVEFSLVFPLFFTLLLGLIEFAMVFNAMLSVNYASRDGALVAAEAGPRDGADCMILLAVDDAISAPTNDSKIVSVEIFKTDANGTPVGTPTVYDRGGAGTTCTVGLNKTLTVAYTQSADGYPVASRCNALSGCADSDTVDNVGVRVTYTHDWVTPIKTFAGGGSGGITFDRTSIMRMEPIL